MMKKNHSNFQDLRYFIKQAHRSKYFDHPSTTKKKKKQGNSKYQKKLLNNLNCSAFKSTNKYMRFAQPETELENEQRQLIFRARTIKGAARKQKNIKIKNKTFFEHQHPKLEFDDHREQSPALSILHLPSSQS